MWRIRWVLHDAVGLAHFRRVEPVARGTGDRDIFIGLVLDRDITCPMERHVDRLPLDMAARERGLERYAICRHHGRSSAPRRGQVDLSAGSLVDQSMSTPVFAGTFWGFSVRLWMRQL